MEEERLRKHLEEAVVGLTDEEWGGLIDDGWVEDVTCGACAPRTVIKLIQKRRKEQRGNATCEQEDDHAGLWTERAQAMCRLFAGVASRDDEVRWFRRVHLDSATMEPSRVVGWLQAAWDVSVPDGWSWPDFFGRVHQSARPWERFEQADLAYILPVDPGPWVAGNMPIPARGPLASLATVDEYLAETYAWDPGQAMLFVLCGLPPDYVGLSARTEIRGRCPAASRITLSVDPFVSPDRVAAFYGRLRRTLLSGGKVQPTRSRSLTLALFIGDRPAEEPWSKRWAAWNEAYPELAYDTLASFRRQADETTSRLLSPRYESPA